MDIAEADKSLSPKTNGKALTWDGTFYTLNHTFRWPNNAFSLPLIIGGSLAYLLNSPLQTVGNFIKLSLVTDVSPRCRHGLLTTRHAPSQASLGLQVRLS